MVAINDMGEFVDVEPPQFITLSPVNMRKVTAEIQGEEEWDGESPRTCAHCGGPIDPERPKNAKFCSRECNWRHSYERKRRKKGLPVFNAEDKRTCAYCGAEIDPSRNAHAKYCNRKCASKDYWRIKKARRESA